MRITITVLSFLLLVVIVNDNQLTPLNTETRSIYFSQYNEFFIANYGKLTTALIVMVIATLLVWLYKLKKWKLLSTWYKFIYSFRDKLVTAITSLPHEANDNNENKDIEKVIYISTLLLRAKLRDTFIININLMSILAAIILIMNDHVYYVLMKYTIITAIGLSIINYGCLYVRVKLGYYGSTSSDVREVLQFIIENSDNGTFGDGTNCKIKVFTEVQEKSEQIPYGTPANNGGSQ